MGIYNQINGDASVILGGSEHYIFGPYNVLLGGRESDIVGEFNTVVGGYNTLEGDYNTILGNMNTASTDLTVMFGDLAKSVHDYSFIYSDGSQVVETSDSHQFLLFSKNGLGINMAPANGVMLSVSGSILADYFEGDGQNITNVNAGQDFWRQKVDGGQNIGIYYMDGPVSVGTNDSFSQLTVSGGIKVADTAQSGTIQNGTIRYNATDGLDLYHNGWVSLDEVDTDTQLTPGRGVSLNGTTFRLDDMGASINESFRFNGSIWAPTKQRFWIDYDDGIYINNKLELFETDYDMNAPLVIESSSSDSDTTYPFVIGGANNMLFSPLDNEILFNVEFRDSNKLNYKIFNSNSSNSNNISSYGASIRVADSIMSFLHTDQAYLLDEDVTMSSFLNISPTSAYTTEVPRATFDTDGSIGFVNTFFDDHLTKGIGHFDFYDNKNNHYLYFDNKNQLNFHAGTDSTPQPIYFKHEGNTLAYFDENGNFILGSDDAARAKLSIFGGGIAMNVAGSRILSSINYGSQTSIKSVSNADPAIQLFTDDTIMATFGDRSIGIGSNYSSDTLLLNNQYAPTIDILSDVASTISLQNSLATHYFKNENDSFQLNYSNGSDSNSLLFIKDNGNISLLTDTYSTIPNEVVINGDIGLKNSSVFHFLNSDREPVLDLFKSSNELVLQQKNSGPIQFKTQADELILSISANAQVVIGADTPTTDAALYVDGDVVFNDLVYYEDSGQQLIQSFVVSHVSDENPDNNNEVRSVKTITIDETSGIVYSVSEETKTLKIQAPEYYSRIYETPKFDGDPVVSLDYIEPVGKDIIEFKEAGGVSINLIDTDYDGEVDSIELYNTLYDGGAIVGDLEIHGDLYVNSTDLDGSEVSNIPYYWERTFGNLHYTGGNVGINTNSPQTNLHVNDTMFSNNFFVSDQLYTQSMFFNNSTSTDVDNDIIFFVDSDNSSVDDQFLVMDDTRPLMSFIGDSTINNNKYGFFNSNPETYVHAINSSDSNGILFESLGTGFAGIRLQTTPYIGTTYSGLIQLNSDIDNNDYGGINESIIAADGNIYFRLNGDSDPMLYIKSNSISVGQEESYSSLQSTSFNSLFIKDSMTVGASFAGVVNNTLGNNVALTIQDKLTVGHLSNIDPGATFFVKDNLAVGEGASDLISDNFKGVIVSRNVGVGIQNPTETLAVDGGVKFKNFLYLYSGDNQRLQLLPNQINVVDPNYGIDFHISESLQLNVNNSPYLSVVDNSVSLGTLSTASIPNSNTNLFIYNDSGDGMLFLEDTASLPSIVFRSNAGTVMGMIGIQADGSDAQLVIESNGSDLSDPDMIIQDGEVGIGKTPDYDLDINGDLKSENLYINNDRLYPVPHGVIMMWSGTKTDIPDGWVLCDGGTVDTNGDGTPDKQVPNLINKFIKGTNLSGIGSTGGQNSVSITSGAHDHAGGEHQHVVDDSGHDHSSSVSSSNLNSSRTSVGSSTPGATGYNINGPGGSSAYYKPLQHNHTYSSSHNHSIQSQTDGSTAQTYTDGDTFNSHHLQSDATAGTHTHEGGAHTHTWDNEPEYYVLAFIIKVSDT